jgi:hypothetical protein
MLRKNSLGQYCTKDGRFSVRAKWDSVTWKQAGWWLWDSVVKKDVAVASLAEAREIIRRRIGTTKPKKGGAK